MFFSVIAAGTLENFLVSGERLLGVSTSIRILKEDVQAQSKLVKEETNIALLSSTRLIIDIKSIGRKQPGTAYLTIDTDTEQKLYMARD